MTATTAPMSTDDYPAYVGRLHTILSNGYYSQVPGITTRSPGLQPRVGVTVGLRPEGSVVTELRSALLRLPDVWSSYGHLGLHVMLGSYADLSVTHPHQPTDRNLSAVEMFDLLCQLTPSVRSGGEAVLSEPRILFSRNTIILAGTPSMSVYSVRQALTDPAKPQVVATGIQPGWGAHLILARARRPLTMEERNTTNSWVRSLRRMPLSFVLPTLMTTAFLVNDDAVSPVRYHVCQLQH